MTSTPQPGRWLHRRGDLARDGWQTVVDEQLPGWQHTGLHVGDLAAGALALGPGRERLVVPLTGGVTVRHTGADTGTGAAGTTVLAGRRSPLDGPTDVLYLPCTATAELTGDGLVAVASAVTDRVLPVQHVAATDVPLELRGAGSCSRQVHNCGTPDVLDAARLIVCEVITPAGNTSSYPPHKHDERIEGHESRLEEIYWFATAPAAAGAPGDGFGLFSTYSSPAGAIDIDARVSTGDVALVPHGYHGPAVALPGYHLYYLNVMAGPDPERVWLISDDPAHAWVRSTWDTQDVDPRLPLRPDQQGDGS